MHWLKYGGTNRDHLKLSAEYDRGRTLDIGQISDQFCDTLRLKKMKNRTMFARPSRRGLRFPCRLITEHAWPHLRQLLKARNIRAHALHDGNEKTSFDLLEARLRLGLSQEQLANALNVTARTLQNWEAGKGTSQMHKRTRDLRELLSRMDDYVVAPQEKGWLSTPLEAFAGKTPQQLIAEGRIRDLVIEFDRLSEGHPV